MTKELTKSFNFIKTYHPEVTQVYFDCNGRWLYTDESNNPPTFSRLPFSHESILQDALDSVENLGLGPVKITQLNDGTYNVKNLSVEFDIEDVKWTSPTLNFER